MCRQSRLVIPGIPHHITQRGNRRQDVFHTEDDRHDYIEILSEYFDKYKIDLVGYCLMTNHTHEIVIPPYEDSLHLAFKAIHRRYAFHKNRSLGWCGHFWQERFFSSPIENWALSTVLRYVERNPVRAGMVSTAEDYEWSSARVHCGLSSSKALKLDPISWWDDSAYGPWSDFLNSQNADKETEAFKDSLKKGLPIGSDAFIEELEQLSGRCQRIRPLGRPRKVMEKG